MMSKQCPCCSGISYEECCERYHKGESPENALQLMRSRYAAYALDLPQYIIDTTHPASPEYSENKFKWKKEISKFSQYSSFNRLEVLDFKEKDTIAVVVFRAQISQGARDVSFAEMSTFEKLDGRWLYRSGRTTEGDISTLPQIDPLKLLPLAYYGDPILRKKAEPVSEITDEIKTLVENMIHTMDVDRAMGIAAPQVHRSLRLFVIRVPIEEGNGTRKLGEVKVFINPTLSSPSSDTWEASEGCMSIPTVREDVSRPREITVEYTDLDGKTTTHRFSGWEAKVIMHENDHINGVLYTDRLDSKLKKKLEPILNNLKKRIHDRKKG